MSPPLSNAVDLLDSAPFLFAVDLAAEVDSVTEPQPVPPAKRARVENGVEQQKTQSPSPQGGSGATLSATPAPADAQASAALKANATSQAPVPVAAAPVQKHRNLSHRRRGRKGKSIYRGVCVTREGKWRAVIYKERKQLYLGVYESEVDAAKAHDRAARHHFGDQAMVNFPTADENAAVDPAHRHIAAAAQQQQQDEAQQQQQQQQTAAAVPAQVKRPSQPKKSEPKASKQSGGTISPVPGSAKVTARPAGLSGDGATLPSAVPAFTFPAPEDPLPLTSEQLSLGLVSYDLDIVDNHTTSLLLETFNDPFPCSLTAQNDLAELCLV